MSDLQHMNVAVTGAGGLIGRRLSGVLERTGCRVWPVRRAGANVGGKDALWNVGTGELHSPGGRIDALVHLAGRNVAARWTTRVKREITDSRVAATEKLCRFLANLPPSERPRVLVCASAVGIYGDRGDEVLTDQSPIASAGTSFLADVCRGWEAATQTAEHAGIRVVTVRLGVVLAAAGGALAKMVTPVKWGFGGPMGSGGQFVPWISLSDVSRLLAGCIADDNLCGVVNAVGPLPVRQLQFIRVLGKVLARPVVFPMPAFMVQAVFGQMGREVLLSSLRVVPSRLPGGFDFSHKSVEEAIRGELAVVDS